MGRLTIWPDNHVAYEISGAAAYSPVTKLAPYLGATANLTVRMVRADDGSDIPGTAWPKDLTPRAGSTTGEFYVVFELTGITAAERAMLFSDAHEVIIAGNDGAGHNLKWTEPLRIHERRTGMVTTP